MIRRILTIIAEIEFMFNIEYMDKLMNISKGNELNTTIIFYYDYAKK